MKFGEQSTKFDGLVGEPVGSPFVRREQREICNNFLKLTGGKPGWHYAGIAYHVAEDGRVDLVGETKVYSTGNEVFHMRIEPK